MFVVSLDNEKCKIKIVCSQIADMGAVSLPASVSVEYGSVASDLITNSMNYGTLEATTSIEGSTLVGLRREYGASTWTTIFTKPIVTYDDLNLTFFDKYTRSRRKYEYEFRLMLDGDAIYTYADSIKCNFDGVYVADEIEEYILIPDVSYDFDDANEIVFQKLLQRKYPRRIQNGLSDYQTGFIECVPMPLDEHGRYTHEDAYRFKMDYVSFLKNGLFKYIKTYKGDVWYAAVNSGIKVNQGEVDGKESVRFSFTEMADPPVADAV